MRLFNFSMKDSYPLLTFRPGSYSSHTSFYLERKKNTQTMNVKLEINDDVKFKFCN